MSSFPPAEGLHHSALSRFLRIASDGSTPAPEAALAEALGKTFFPASVETRFRINDQAKTLEEKVGQWTATQREIPVRSPSRGNAQLTWTADSHVGDYRFNRASSEAAEGFRISQSRGGGFRLELEIEFLRVGPSFPVDRIGDFRRNISGSTVLFQAFMALKAASLVLQVPASSWKERLTQTATQLHRFQAFPGTSYLQESLVQGFLDDLLAAGRDIYEIGGFEETAGVASLANQVASLAASSDSFSRLARILATISGQETSELPVAERKFYEPQAISGIVANWTSLHARARRLLRQAINRQDLDAFDAEFGQAAKAALPGLANVLLSNSPNEWTGSALASSWLRLWFCLTLLQEIPEVKKRSIDLERLSFYSSLAYVVRECLRAFLEKGKVRFHLPSFADALSALVEYHATEYLKLPQELNLGGILLEIGQLSQGAGESFATGHLHHVLEMYIGGMFLLDTRLTGGEDFGGVVFWEGATICEVLASGGGTKPGTNRQLALRQSFGLGALLHDIGMLLFPRWSNRAAELGHRQNRLHGRLLKVRSALAESVQGLLATCKTELLADEIFRESADPAVVDWIARRGDLGEADHSVLGSWYLAHHAKRVVNDPVLRSAARAILFHAIPTQEIQTDEDQVAALLALCDEVFAWHQSPEIPQRRRIRQEAEVAGLEPRARDSIFSAIRIPGLHFEVSAISRHFVHTLNVKENMDGGATKAWPRIELELKTPDELPMQVYEYWLILSQNLRRIQKSASGFGPNLYLRSVLSSQQASFGSRDLLARAGLKAGLGLRPYLRRWLELHADLGTDGGFEAIAIGSFPEQLGESGIIEEHLPELAKLVAAVVHELEVRSKTSADSGGLQQNGR